MPSASAIIKASHGAAAPSAVPMTGMGKYLRDADNAGANFASPDPSRYIPLYAVTGVMAAIFIIAPFLVKRGPDRGVYQCCIMLTVFSLWIFWTTVYIAHLNPLVGPRLDNFTVAWMAREHILAAASAASGEP